MRMSLRAHRLAWATLAVLLVVPPPATTQASEPAVVSRAGVRAQTHRDRWHFDPVADVVLLDEEAPAAEQPLALVPDLTVDATSNNNPYPITADATYGNVYDGTTSTGVINQSAGTLTVNTAFYLGNTATGNGAYNLSGGTLAPAGNVYVGYNGTGSVVQNGASSVNFTSATLYLGYNAGSVGTYSLADSATLQFGGLYIGLSSAGANIFTQSGGTLTNSSSAPFGVLDIGANPGSSGTFNLSGGTVSVGTLIVGDAGTGVVNQTGGSVTITSGFSLGKTAFTPASGAPYGGNGTYNLSAGSLTTAGMTLGVSDRYLNYGTFVQSGSTTVTSSGTVSLGGGGGSTGTYSLTGTTMFNAPTLVLGVHGYGSFTQSSGTANFTTAVNLGSSGAGKGLLTLSGGTFSTPAIYDGNSPGGFFGQSVNGNSVVQNGTSAVTATAVHLGLDSNGTLSSYLGSYSLADTATLNGATLYIGEFSSAANVFAQSGGTAKFTSAVYLGYNTGSVGTLNFSGGTLTSGGGLSVGYQGTGTVNQTGGTLTVGSGGVTMGPVGNASSGVYNLGGTGTLATPSVNGAAGSVFNFNGGTLQATTDASAFLVGTTNVQAGGATLDTNGHAVTIAQGLAHDGSLGNSPDGGLKKIGLGTLTLTGQSTLTGPIVVNAGTLALADGLGAALGKTASLTVNAGGTVALGFSNQLSATGPATFNANSGPAAGASVAFNTAGNSQTLGALSLSSTSVVDLGSGASRLRFADSHGITWTGVLAVWDWTGTVITGGGADELLFGANTASLSTAQLAEIQFYSDSGATLLAAAGFASSGTGEVVPGGPLTSTVPEPATWLGGMMLVSVAARSAWRRGR